jgi:hypothetical protein
MAFAYGIAIQRQCPLSTQTRPFGSGVRTPENGGKIQLNGRPL